MGLRSPGFTDDLRGTAISDVPTPLRIGVACNQFGAMLYVSRPELAFRTLGVMCLATAVPTAGAGAGASAGGGGG